MDTGIYFQIRNIMMRRFHPKQGGKENIQTVKSINVVLPFPFPLRNIFMNVIYKLYLYKKEHEVNKSNQVLLPSDSLPPKEFLQNLNTPKVSNSGKKGEVLQIQILLQARD